jgi:hypothetical protein
MIQNQTLPRTVAIVMLLTGVLAVIDQPAFGAFCLDGFKKRGSIFTRWVYTASSDFADLSVRVAVERLRQHLPSKKIEVLAADAAQGVLHCRTIPDDRQRAFDVDFTVSQLGSGVRVKEVLSLPPTGVSDAGLKEVMCDTVSVAALAASPAAEAAASTPQPAPESPQSAPRATAAAATPHAEPQEPPLTNEDVIKLFQAGLASDLIVTKIMQSSSVAFDLSTNGLVALANLKIPHDVIAAMMQRARPPQVASKGPGALHGKNSGTQPGRLSSRKDNEERNVWAASSTTFC